MGTGTVREVTIDNSSVEVYWRFAVNLFSFRVFPLFFKQLSQMNLGKEVQLSFASDTNCEKHTLIKRP